MNAAIASSGVASPSPFAVPSDGDDRSREIERRPVAHRIIDRVRAGPDPERRIGLLLVPRHVGGRYERTINIGAGRGRLAVADDLGAHLRPDAVRADQRRRVQRFARGQPDGDAARAGLEVDDPTVGAQLDRR